VLNVPSRTCASMKSFITRGSDTVREAFVMAQIQPLF
jgi:hypothetical protein